MKIDKKLIKELVDNLKEFELTELEYQEGQTKIKVSRALKGIDQPKTSAVVEAMKTMNHVPSTADGEVKKILVEDGQAVEFGQTLVILK